MGSWWIARPAYNSAQVSQASCTQGRRKNAIGLARLALFYVIVDGFRPNLSVFGPNFSDGGQMIVKGSDVSRSTPSDLVTIPQLIHLPVDF
jgi:hypothetical protein